MIVQIQTGDLIGRLPEKGQGGEDQPDPEQNAQTQADEPPQVQIQALAVPNRRPIKYGVLTLLAVVQLGWLAALAYLLWLIL